MRPERSLRRLLVINSLLAVALTWTLFVTAGPLVGSAEAAGQYRSTRRTGPPAEALTGVGNAAARQRKEIIDRLGKVEQQLAEMSATLTSGKVGVRIVNTDELSIDYDRLADAVRSRSE
ncbi:MAG: hypothetical protein GWP75_13935 [Planctomycetia bacterium]|jgi:hypothetical protein|nr:hypothetical protein [Planctomycetia bacterium]